MGETRVDLLHLLEDLRDAYPGALEETILTEIVANALDSSATRIELRPGPQMGRSPSSTMAPACDGASWPGITTSRRARRRAARGSDLPAWASSSGSSYARTS